MMKLSREEIENYRLEPRAYPREVVNDLCDLALRSLEAQPDAGEPVLAKPVQVGATRFHAGVKVRLLVERAEREYEYQSRHGEIAALPSPDQRPAAVRVCRVKDIECRQCGDGPCMAELAILARNAAGPAVAALPQDETTISPLGRELLQRAASPAGQWVSEHERNVIVQAAAKALCSRAYPGRTLDEALSPNTSLWGRLLPEAELAVDAALKSLAMLRASPEPRKP